MDDDTDPFDHKANFKSVTSRSYFKQDLQLHKTWQSAN